MILAPDVKAKLDKTLELIWSAKDKLNANTTEDEMTLAIGQIRRAENILSNVQFELTDSQDDAD